MFRLLRYFSIASLIAILVVTYLLAVFYKKTAQEDLIRAEEGRNVSLTQAVLNSVGPRYHRLLATLFGASASGEAIRTEIEQFKALVQSQMKGLAVLRVQILNLEGFIVFSTDPRFIGQKETDNPAFQGARSGEVTSVLLAPEKSHVLQEGPEKRDIISSYIPIRRSGPGSPIEAVFELDSDVTSSVEAIAHTQKKVVFGIVSGLGLLYVVLFFIVRHADRTIKLQEAERRRAEAALAEQAVRDSLTGLYNRRHFDTQAKKEIARADRDGRLVGILLCDLDGFKALNDAHGHLKGDHALKVVAESIQRAVRGSDLVFRWGGDEMVVILSDTDRQGVLTAASRIRRGVLNIARQIDYHLDVSIGISLYPENGLHVDDLVRVADRAMYIAKKGGGRIHLGEEEYRLSEDSIRVVFQPVVDVHTHRIVGHEALSRDAQGKLSVLDFFRKYEAVGQLHELKLLCFRKQLKLAQSVGLKKVFINVDFAILSQGQPLPTPDDMEVVLEISETEALHDVENHLVIAKDWRKRGYKFAIDDFGAGFISLPFIARLIPEYIKLDRSTLLQAVASERFKWILRDLLLGMRNCSTEGIIAEGVEAAAELEMVKELNIPLVQGFLLGKPEEIKPQKR